MSQYKILARKYRPQRFADVVGQSPIVATLKNAIRMKRTAHAYLFCGCRGTGKTTLARLFAKALNCSALLDEIEPCNECPSCHEIAAGHAIDVFEIDGASHRGIEDIRQINETIAFAPIGGRYKIYLIDEVHMLTKEAFNALLKTLEEPPPHVKFFFCTTEPHKIPATILSRCQRFNLRRIAIEKLEARLAQIAADSGIVVEREALTIISERAEGSLRDALSLFDQIIAFKKGEICVGTVTELIGLPSKKLFFSIDQAGVENEIMAAFKIAGEVFSSGNNLTYFLEELISHFRTLLLIKHGAAAIEQTYKQSASYYRSDQLVEIMEFLMEGQQNIKSAPSERTALEMLLLKIIRSHKQISLETLVNRLFTLEKQLSTSENPAPKPEEIPPKKEEPAQMPKSLSPTPSLPIEEPSPEGQWDSFTVKDRVTDLHSSPNPVLKDGTRGLATVQEQSRFDTIMRFAAKELNGSLKKE